MFLCFRHRLFSAVVVVDSLKSLYLFFGGRLIELLVLPLRAARVGNAL